MCPPAVFNGTDGTHAIPKWKPTSKPPGNLQNQEIFSEPPGNWLNLADDHHPKILKSSEIIRNHQPSRGASRRSCRKTARALTMRRVRTMRISFTTRRLLDCWSSLENRGNTEVHWPWWYLVVVDQGVCGKGCQWLSSVSIWVNL